MSRITLMYVRRTAARTDARHRRSAYLVAPGSLICAPERVDITDLAGSIRTAAICHRPLDRCAGSRDLADDPELERGRHG
jgi:hypothetical protein